MPIDPTTTHPRLAIVADDLTGAADAAAPFAAAGVPSAVALRPGHDPGACVVAVTTESRDRPQPEAERAVRDAASWLASEVAPAWWYKKIDSMLRGHPAAESLALAESIGGTGALLAPALPSCGRTVRAGVAFAGAEAVARLTDPADGAPENPTSTGDRAVGHIALADVRDGERLGAAIRFLTPGVTIADGETDDDLDAVAAAALAAGAVLLGGSAGLATRLAARLPLRRGDRPPLPGSPPVLAVVASRHRTAAAQVAAVEAAGVAAVVRAPTDGTIADPATARGLAERVAAALRAGRPAVLTTAGGAPSPLPGRELARGLAAVVADPAVVALAGSLYLSGGDAAAACLGALAADALRLGGEVESGIPWGRIVGGACDGRPVVTKAGSFGDAGALGRCLAFLAGEHGGRAT